MTWKDVVNSGLRRATGYSIVRAVPSPVAAPAGPVTQRPKPPAPRSKPPGPGAKRPPPGPKPTQQSLPAHFDGEMRQIIERVRPRTMTSPAKLAGLILAARYVVDHDIPGDIVECGVWRGGSMQAAALALQGRGRTDRELHLFDTFEGMTAPTEHDVRVSDGEAAASLMAAQRRTKSVWAVADLDDVRAGMAETGYPSERIHYHQGPVEETVPGRAPETIAILRLDTDWYESTRHELEHLYDRLSPGGVLIIDDYGHWEGSRRATEEFLERTGAKLLLLPISSGRIAVKPFTG